MRHIAIIAVTILVLVASLVVTTSVAFAGQFNFCPKGSHPVVVKGSQGDSVSCKESGSK